VGYFELKLHKYILGTPKTNITSCKKGHNRCPLNYNSVLFDSSVHCDFIWLLKSVLNVKTVFCEVDPWVKNMRNLQS